MKTGFLKILFVAFKFDYRHQKYCFKIDLKFFI